MDCEAEINFKKFHQVIQEYEKLIKELTSDIDVYKSEYEANSTTITALVNENKELASRLKEALKIAEHDEIAHIYSENDLIENLKKQLSSLAKEKESVVQLWQTALKTVDYLEDELRLYEGRTHGYVPKHEIKKIQISYQQQIDELHNKIDECNAKLQETRKTSALELYEKTQQLEKETNQLADARNAIERLQEKLTDSDAARSALQAALVEKNKQIDGFIVREEIAKNKVREAVNIVETALMEKDAALLREAQTRDEMARLFEAVQEAEAKTRAEINQIKTESQAKCNNLQQELVKAKEEIQSKNFEIEKQSFKQEALQKEIEVLQKGRNVESDMSKLLVLEKHLESTFQKLLLSERKNLQLSAERDSIRADMEQMAAHFERDIKSREIEKRSLENRFAKVQDELNKSKNNLLETTVKLEALNRKYNDFKELYKSKKGSCRKSISDIVAKNSKAYNELKKCYEKQVHITKKWKAEAVAVYKTLGKKIKEFNAQCKSLKVQNRELNEKLLEAESIISKYQQSLQTLCFDAENLNT